MFPYCLSLPMLLLWCGVACSKAQEVPFALVGNRFELQDASVFYDEQTAAQILAVNGEEHDVVLWNLEDRTRVARFPADDRVTVLIETVVHPVSRKVYIATAGRSTGTTSFTINLWLLESGTGKLVAQSTSSLSQIVDMKFVVDYMRGEILLAVASLDGVLRLYHKENLAVPVVSVLAHVPFIGAITTLERDTRGSNEDVTIVTGGSDDMKTWLYTNGSLTQLSTRVGHFGAITSLSAADLGYEKVLISAGTDNFINVWTLNGNVPMVRVPSIGPFIEAVTVSGDYILATFNRTIVTWDLQALLAGELKGQVVNDKNVGTIRSIEGYVSVYGESLVASAGHELWIWRGDPYRPTSSPLTPSFTFTYVPTSSPTPEPTDTPSTRPTPEPTFPTPPTTPTPPTHAPSSAEPTFRPTKSPVPTSAPSELPSSRPTKSPTNLDDLILKEVRVVFSRVRLVPSHLDGEAGFVDHFKEQFIEPVVSQAFDLNIVVQRSILETLTVDFTFYIVYEVSFKSEDFIANMNTRIKALKLSERNKFCLESDVQVVELPMSTSFPTIPPTNVPPGVEAAALTFAVFGIFGCVVGTVFAVCQNDGNTKIFLSAALALIDTVTDVLFVWTQWYINQTLAVVSLFTLVGFVIVHFTIGWSTLRANLVTIERNPVAILITMVSSLLSSTIVCFFYDVEEFYLDYATFADIAEDVYQGLFAILALLRSVDLVSIASLVVSALSIIWRTLELSLVRHLAGFSQLLVKSVKSCCT